MRHWGAFLLGAWIAAVGVLVATWPSAPPPPPMKKYNLVIMSDMTKVLWEGTHITNNGFCTIVWKGNVADTVVCTPHLITEAEEEAAPVQQSGKPTQQAEAR